VLIIKPDYYDTFRCLMGACSDTCCAAWDIVIDEKSAEFYRSVPGPTGDRIRSSMRTDEDGDLCFSVEGGHCPLLTEDGLCSIQLQFGEDKVCDTCRSHPRFIEEYGSFKEMALAASCPAAIELILSHNPCFLRAQDDDPEFVCEDVDEELLRALLPCRDRAFALLNREDLPWKVRLSALLSFGSELQITLLTEGAEALPAVAGRWASPTPEQLSFPQPDNSSIRKTETRILSLLAELEILDEKWAADTTQASAAAPIPFPSCPEALELRWAVYLLWRWFLRADFDGDIYGKLALPVLSILTLRALSRGESFPEWARRWAKEVEHSSENLNALFDALCAEELLSPDRLIGAL